MTTGTGYGSGHLDRQHVTRRRQQIAAFCVIAAVVVVIVVASTDLSLLAKSGFSVAIAIITYNVWRNRKLTG
jgi:hypothetical protein